MHILSNLLVAKPVNKLNFLGTNCISVLLHRGQRTFSGELSFTSGLLGKTSFNCLFASSMSTASNVYSGVKSSSNVSSNPPPPYNNTI